MKRKITQLTILMSLICSQSMAQNWLGNTFSNYAGSNGVYLNPSSIAESKYAYHLNLWGHGANIYNNYLNYEAPFGIRDWAQGDNSTYTNSNGNIAFNQAWLSEMDKAGTKQISLTRDIRLPGFMFPVGPNANMSINLRQRSGVQAFGISSPFARVLRHGIDTNNTKLFGGADGLNTNQLYSTGNFSSNVENYQELGITYAGNWSKTEKHTFNVGTTFKLIRGLGGAYFNSTGGQFSINSSDSITLVGGDYDYGHTPYTNIRQPLENDYQLLYPSAGTGLGFDFGLTYMYNPNKSKYFKQVGCNENEERDNYLIKVAAAVNDIGFINYKDAQNFSKTMTTNGLRINHGLVASFNNTAVDGFDTFNASTVNKLGFTQSTGFVSQLPTALNMSLDIRATKRFFVGVNWNQDLKKNTATGMRATSYLAVLPRFEYRGFELSTPIVWGQNYQDLNMGLYARLGPFFLGSENINGLLNKVSTSSYSGADIYGGIAMGIGHCPLWVEEEYDEEIVMTDTTIHELDTIREERVNTLLENDTIRIKEIIRPDTIIQRVIETRVDTVVVEKLVTKEAVNEEVARRERTVAMRERNVAERERLVSIRERRTNCVQCEKDKAALKAKVTQLDKIIVIREARIKELEREIAVLKSTVKRSDTIRISDCGPKIYKDNEGVLLDKCQYLTYTNKNLLNKVNKLEADVVRLKADLTKCQVEKDKCCKKSELDEAERKRIEEARIKAEKLRQVEIEAARKKAEADAARKKVDKASQEAARKRAEEQRRAAEAAKKAADEKRKLDLEKANAEAKKRAENERIRKELELKRQEEAKKAAEAAARKRAEQEAIRKAQEKARQEAAKKQAEASRKAAEEAARQAAAKKAAADAAKKAADKAKKEAAQKAAEEKRKKEEEERKKEELK